MKTRINSLITLFFLGVLPNVFAQTKTSKKSIEQTILAPSSEQTIKKIKAESLQYINGLASFTDKFGVEIVFTGKAISLWSDHRMNTEQGYVSGLKQGLYLEYTEKGILVAQETWAKGKKNGAFRYADEKTGIVVVMGDFLDDSLHAEVKGFYMNGTLQYAKHYNLGVREGSALSYYQNGALEQVAFFVNDMPDGAVIAYYQDSTTRYIKEYERGVYNGKFFQFHRNGCRATEMYFKHGLRDSISRTWDAVTCKLISEGVWTRGSKNGIFVDYNAFGDTLHLASFQSGIPEGRFFTMADLWDEKSKSMVLTTETAGLFVQGKREGYWIHGQVSHYQERYGKYRDGEMIGKWLFMDNQGRPLVNQVYDENGEVLKEKFFKRKN
ncbi:MAG: hypothetical protein CK532_04995 [Flavobacteriales bacterium]|nr:MAG: hypothetical protein CK532_04995 [Flavobacteriales bacterium]